MLGLALGIAFLSGFGLGSRALVIWFCLGAAAVARRSLPASMFAIILVIASIGVLHGERHTAQSSSPIATGPFEGTIEVADGSYLTQLGQRFVVRVPDSPGLRLCASSGAVPRVLTGDVLFAEGRVTEIRDLSEGGQAAAGLRGCAAQLRIDWMTQVEPGNGFRNAVAGFRVDLSRNLMRLAPGDAGALLSGLVTGDDGGLSKSAGNAFLRTGTTHITAISGANFAMLILLLGVISTGAMRRNAAYVVGASVVLWLYALMVGLQPSALRAALLATAVLLGRYLGRRPDLLTLTVILAAVQVAIRPQDFWTLAFQLSVAATIALIVVFDGSEREGDRSWGVALVSSVLAAQLATIPILAWQIGTLSLTGLVANLVVGPLAGLAFPIALVGGLAGQVSLPLEELIVLPAEWICRVIIIFVEWVDRTAPGSVQLGQPVPAAIAIIAGACWFAIAAMSGDVRRGFRHGLAVVRGW